MHSILMSITGGVDQRKIGGIGSVFGLLVRVLPGPNKQQA